MLHSPTPIIDRNRYICVGILRGVQVCCTTCYHTPNPRKSMYMVPHYIRGCLYATRVPIDRSVPCVSIGVDPIVWPPNYTLLFVTIYYSVDKQNGAAALRERTD